MCFSLGLLAVGFAVAAACLSILGHSDGGVALGLIVGIPIGFLECWVIRHSGRQTQFLLDGEVFPFFAVGVASAIVVF